MGIWIPPFFPFRLMLSLNKEVIKGEKMNRIKSLFLSVLVTILTASVMTTVVYAATTITETNLNHYNYGTDSPITVSNKGCAGKSCRYLNQSSSYSIWSWSSPSKKGIYDWYAYCPTIGRAAANYGLTGDSWVITMDQSNSNNQGNYVYIGYNDHNNKASLFTGNSCVSGWSCSNLPVYWDNIQYSNH